MRAITAIVLVLAISATANGQWFDKLLSGGAKTEQAPPKSEEDLQKRLAEVEARIQKFNEDTAARRAELAAELTGLDQRSKEIRAALEKPGVSKEESEVLTVERDAVDERATTIRDVMEAIDGQLEALHALKDALRLRSQTRQEVADFAKNGTQDIATATLQEAETAERASQAAKRAVDLSSAKLIGFQEELSTAAASVASRGDALKRLRDEAQASEKEMKEKSAGLDEAGTARLNRRSRARTLRVNTAELAVKLAERRSDAATTNVEAAKVFLEANRARAEMLEKRAAAIDAKVVITEEQLDAEKQALETAEKALASQARRQDRVVAQQRAALREASQKTAALRAEREKAEGTDAAGALDKRIAVSVLREEITRRAMTLAAERQGALKLKIDLAQARVKRVETMLNANSPEFDRDRLPSLRGDLKDLVGQWTKRRQIARSSVEQTMQAARDAFSELTAAKEQLSLLEAKQQVTESEGKDLALLKDRVDALGERRRILVELSEVQSEKSEVTNQVLTQYRRAEDFVVGLIGGTDWIAKKLTRASEEVADAWKRLLPFFQSILVFAAGFMFAGWLARQVSRVFRVRGNIQAASFARKMVLYPLVFFTVTMGLGVLDIQLSAILAAAGILTVAVGFAAQNSVGNIISGIFLMIDRPFKIGEAVDVGGTMGVVLSIDLLSTKLRTFDNLFLRIPNETIVKSNITNFVAHPVRRYDVPVGISYTDDVDKAIAVLTRIARNNKNVLENPAPEVRLEGFGDNSVDMLVRFWASWTKGYALLHQLRVEIKKAFDEEGISIPFPQRTLWWGDKPPEPTGPPEVVAIPDVATDTGEQPDDERNDDDDAEAPRS
ncbi:MAG: mechanosensitive ion channel [Myxococcales bacterium]|nr:mechanosensitive ion channel [Myxococcales bacterium]